MRLRSLRARVIVGSLLWTAGLLAVSHLLVLTLIHRFPPMSRVDHHKMLAGALVSMAAGLVGLQSGLSPFAELRRRLGAVRDGSAARVVGEYPTEVQPLVNDLNALLEHREKVVNRALATEIDQQIDRMRRQIDYHLAHARSAAASSASTAVRASIAASAEGLVRAVQRLHADRGLRIEIDTPASHAFRGQREDLDEMLGNLLDNACKWASARVTLTCSKEGEHVVIAVDDDGPGIEPSMREAVMRRGVQADEAAQGSGLGLAIVRDLAEIHGGSISLEESPMGGARALLTLPTQDVV